MGEVLEKSDEARKTLMTALKQQRSRAFLASQLLPPVPKSRDEPRITSTAISKNVTKKFNNASHGKLTNGGFTRTSYGGYYMH